MDKKFTIMVIPGNSARTFSFGATKRTLTFLALFIASLMGATGYFTYEKIALAKETTELASVMRQSQTRKQVIEKLNVRVKSLDKNLTRLRQLERQLRIMARLKPSKQKGSLGLGGVSGDELRADLGDLATSEQRLIRRLNRQFQDIEMRSAEQEAALKDLMRSFRSKLAQLSHTPSIWPVKGWISSNFGYRISPFTNQREFHGGIDIVAREGTPIYAPADGVVTKSYRLAGYGKVIEIRHLQGVVTRYGHNSVNIAKVGQRVKRGDIIAKVGSTGRSTGPHLHYEVRINDVAVNPRLYVVRASR